MTTDYSVHAEARAPEGAASVDDPAEAVDRLVDLLIDHHGVCGVEKRSWSVTISFEAVDARQAGDHGAELVTDLAVKAGLPPWPLARVEAVRGDVLDEDQSHPNLPALVSGPEAAEILGVARQRVHQLAATHPDFPSPLYELAAGKLWDRAAVEGFGEAWARRPGRPPRPHDADRPGRP